MTKTEEEDKEKERDGGNTRTIIRDLCQKGYLPVSYLEGR